MKRPQFALRDLLWLAVVIGLAVGWWIDRSKVDKSKRELGYKLDSVSVISGHFVNEMQKAGYDFEWADEFISAKGPESEITIHLRSPDAAKEIRNHVSDLH